jgi:flavin reductase (DIM6/NTAB) family NADH-FMN oxidoreductase RutF
MPWKRVNPARIHRLFYPQVPVVITVEFDGRIGGMPAIWHTPLSFKPPIVGVVVAPEHKTYEMIRGAKAFGVNWLDFSYAKQVGQLGDTSGKDYVNKLSAVGLEVVKGKASGQPLIAEASAALECRHSDTHRTGTHELIIGQVVAAGADKSFSNYWNHTQYHPLLYAGTKNEKGKAWVFKSLSEKTVTVPLRRQPQIKKRNRVSN